jgi:C1A family cysteine protease
LKSVVNLLQHRPVQLTSLNFNDARHGTQQIYIFINHPNMFKTVVVACIVATVSANASPLASIEETLYDHISTSKLDQMYKTAAIGMMVAVSTATNVHSVEYYEKKFFEYIASYKLHIKDAKEFVRILSIFADNLDFIEKHNSEVHTYTLGENQFTHLSHAEWKSSVFTHGLNVPKLRRNPSSPVLTAKLGATNPSSVNWVTAGAVTPVKDQGNCGACWSFSATGSIEGAYQIKYGILKSFSEQELMSCDVNNGNIACNGGWMDTAFSFAQNNGGLTTENQYPYTSGDSGATGTCFTTGFTIDPLSAPKSYTDVLYNNLLALETAVAQQPVSIGIEADQPAFQFYASGVVTGNCGQSLDHAVLAVGYGTENGLNYWLIKNTWGTSWGEAGYVKILKSSANLCGVLSVASYPNL